MVSETNKSLSVSSFDDILYYANIGEECTWSTSRPMLMRNCYQNSYFLIRQS